MQPVIASVYPFKKESFEVTSILGRKKDEFEPRTLWNWCFKNKSEDCSLKYFYLTSQIMHSYWGNGPQAPEFTVNLQCKTQVDADNLMNHLKDLKFEIWSPQALSKSFQTNDIELFKKIKAVVMDNNSFSPVDLHQIEGEMKEMEAVYQSYHRTSKKDEVRSFHSSYVEGLDYPQVDYYPNTGDSSDGD